MRSECNYYFVCYANAQVLYLIMCTENTEPKLYVYAHAHICSVSLLRYILLH